MFLDSHCHLDKLDLSRCPGGLSEALSAAREQGVSPFLCIGIGPENLAAVVSIAAATDDVFASVGVHPSEYNDDAGLLAQLPAVMAQLDGYLQHDKVVAVGETGLDFSRLAQATVSGARDAQIESFRAHLALARNAGMPVIVHTREAQAETLAAIRDCASPAAGVLHCFTESWDMASEAMDMGYSISISGIVTFRNADNVREVARRVPLDCLLVETDSPWLAPVPFRGRPNQPAYVAEVYRFLAALRNEPLDTLVAAVRDNFSRRFPKAAAFTNTMV